MLNKFKSYPIIIILLILFVGAACREKSSPEVTVNPSPASNTEIAEKKEPLAVDGIARPNENPSGIATTQAEAQVRLITNTPTMRPSPTPPPTATLSPTPSPSPTYTPIPTLRLQEGHEAYYHGRYDHARLDFDALLTAPDASTSDKITALYWRGRSELKLNRYPAAQASFEIFVQAYPDNVLTRSAYFNLALALENLDNYTDTIQAYQASLLPEVDPIGAYIYERMADLAIVNEDYTQAATWYQSAVDQAGNLSFEVHLREGLALAYLGLADLDAALKQYDMILAVSQIPVYRAKILRLKGEAYAQNDNLAQAAEFYNQVIYDYPETYEAYLALVNLVQADLPVDDFQRGYVNYYGGNNYQPALSALERYLATEPEKNADEALWLMAWSARALGNYDTAITYFEDFIQTHPNSPNWGDAHLQIARTYGWAGDTAEAVRAYRHFASTYPNHGLAGEALWRAAIWESREDHYAEAARNFQSMAQLYPQNTYADDALHQAGLNAYLNRDLEAANTAWTRLLVNYPGSEYAREASYWQAKTLLELGETITATEKLEQLSAQPLNYYALRAQDLLANDRMYAPSVNITLPTESSEEEKAEAEAWLQGWLGLTDTARLEGLDQHLLGDPAFIRGEALRDLGLYEEAYQEYDQVITTWNDNPVAMYQLAQALKERQMYRLSISCALRLSQLSPVTDPNDLPIYIRRLIYPTYYAELILPETENLNLDSALVFALIRQESLFDPEAQSVADARGLMQIVPLTGGDIAQRTNTSDYTHDKLWLPYFNVEFGTWYLKQLLDFFDDNQFAALAGYNAGPGRVQSWLEGDDDLDVFVARMTLSEPQEYIRRIYLNVSAYRAIYGQSQ